MAIEKITLPAARKNAGLTQKQLADALNVSESTVYKWEKGEGEPTVTRAYQIAAAVGLHIDNIIFLPQTTV